MAKRNKTNLAQLVEAQKELPGEPASGPGSAACFCRVMDRRMRRKAAQEALQASAGTEANRAPASIFQVQDASDLAVLHSELLEARAKGIRFEVLVFVEPEAV